MTNPANAGLKTSEQALRSIMNHEGLRLTAYVCPAGIWTIGYGHTGTAKPGMVINRRDAERLLRNDILTAENHVKRSVSVPLTQGQFDALVSFVFNIGPTRFRSSTLLRMLNGGQPQAAKNQLHRWIFGDPRKPPLPGLVKRRKDEADMWDGKHLQPETGGQS